MPPDDFPYDFWLPDGNINPKYDQLGGAPLKSHSYRAHSLGYGPN